MNKNNSGFTLFELLIVVAILAILVTTSIVAIDAPRRINETNDAKRASDARNILMAVHQYVVDNQGKVPAGITNDEQQLGTSVDGCVNLHRGCNALQDACLDLSTTLSDYFLKFPVDPTNGSNSKTNYSISINSKNIVTVKACNAQGKNEISISM